MTNSHGKEKTMNFYENEALEQKLEELSDQLGYLVLDLLVVSRKKWLGKKVSIARL